MSTIYQRCLYVIVWLDRTSYAAALQLNEIAQEDFNYTAAFRPAELLLTNGYFNRLWIVQEVLLPRQVHIMCGDAWVSWDVLRKLIWNHPKWFLTTSRSINHTAVAWLFGSTGGEASRPSLVDEDRVSLSRCMTLFGQMQCADPRDKVYGILGLISEEDRPPIDYQKSVMEVILDVIMALCRVHRRSAIIKPVHGNSAHRICVLLRIAGSLELNRNHDLAFHMFVEEVCEIEERALLGRQASPITLPITALGSEPEESNGCSTRVDALFPWLKVAPYTYWYECGGQRHYRDTGTAKSRFKAKSAKEQHQAIIDRSF